MKNMNRDKILESLGLKILHFEDIEVKKNMNRVLEIIQNYILEKKKSPLPPLKGGLATAMKKV